MAPYPIARLFNLGITDPNLYYDFGIETCESASDEIVGHLSMEISRPTKFLLQRRAVIKATLPFTNYRKSYLVQDGLEIPSRVSVSMPATLKNKQIIEKPMFCMVNQMTVQYSQKSTKKNLSYWRCHRSWSTNNEKNGNGYKDIPHKESKKQFDSTQTVAKICNRVRLTI